MEILSCNFTQPQVVEDTQNVRMSVVTRQVIYMKFAFLCIHFLQFFSNRFPRPQFDHPSEYNKDMHIKPFCFPSSSGNLFMGSDTIETLTLFFFLCNSSKSGIVPYNSS